MTFWPSLFLGIIAFATLTTALVQVGFIVYGWLMARQIARLLAQIERDIKPLSDSLNAMIRDAARATSLAAAQVERVDKLFTQVIERVEQTAEAVQQAVVAPLRDGAALIAGIRAAIDVVRDLMNRSPRSRNCPEDEDALFIG